MRSADDEGPMDRLSDWFDEHLWDNLPEMPVGGWFEDLIDWAKTDMRDGIDIIKDSIEWMVDSLAETLNILPSVFMVVIFAALGWIVRGWKFGIVSFAGMALVAWTPYWEDTMDTLASVIVASVIALLIAIPVGILASENRHVSLVVRPILDFMQTLPAFVYLLPTVMLFSVGTVPGVIATIVFSMPPGVRLTELGLRQVDHEVVEAGESFGASPARILGRIKLPLALPTIMAGVNQVIMLALSMVVIAGLVGGGGLGREIMNAITRVQVAEGFNAGLAVVVLAIFLDRITEALSKRTKVAKAQSAMQNA